MPELSPKAISSQYERRTFANSRSRLQLERHNREIALGAANVRQLIKEH
jgi:hypothetical protein